MSPIRPRSRLLRSIVIAFLGNGKASSAVEFALVAAPFIFTLIAILQVGLYYITQSALDSGVVAEADTLVGKFYLPTTPVTPLLSDLTTAIAGKAGGLIQLNGLLVDLQPFSNLTSGVQPIGSNTTVDLGSKGNLLALRAQAHVTALMPLFGNTLTVSSAVLVRRQGY